MFVVDDDALHALERHDDDVVDIFKTAVGLLRPIHHLQIKFQVFSGPLTAVVAAVLLAVFLDGHVGEVHEHVIHLCDIRRIELVAKPAESFIVNVCFYRSVTRAKT